MFRSLLKKKYYKNVYSKQSPEREVTNSKNEIDTKSEIERIKHQMKQGKCKLNNSKIIKIKNEIYLEKIFYGN